MAETAPFGGIVRDLSNAVGFQFEFVCLRCGNGYRSSFIAASAVAADAGGYAVGKVIGKIPLIGDFLGDTASDMVKDKAKDAALNRATAEVAPAFAQCPRCGRWRCQAVCWNAAANLCVDCAPRQYMGQPAPMYQSPAPGYPAPQPGYAPPQSPSGMPMRTEPGYGAPPVYAPSAPPVGYPGAYPYAPAPPVMVQTYAPPSRTSGNAVVSLLSGLFMIGWLVMFGIFVGSYSSSVPGSATLPFMALGFAFLSALSAIIFGHVALSQINRSRGTLTGGGLAVAGLVLGYLYIVLGGGLCTFALSFVEGFRHITTTP